MEKSIFTFIEKCVACKGCEIACAVEHSSDKTLFGALADNPRPRQRVRVEAAGAYSYPARCQHCQEAACIAACPMGAMTRDPDTHAVYVDSHKCVGCWMCVMVCPFGGVSADPVAKKAHKCDRCPERTAVGLDPACVAACPTKAMVFATPEEIAELRRQATAAAAAGIATTPVASSVAAWRTMKGGA
ncbi:MAG: 4Fe-4S dicluster domain-containing protein [Rhodocyclales bacterium]|nr:4Fe-4S dicluster domain-containing protein [Rhodocyclales bacterium]